MWSRTKKTKTPFLPPPSKFDRWSEGDLINCVESEMRRSGELFRGFSHSELDQAWILEEMDVHMSAALEAVRTLRRRVAVVQSS
jgi:hypothetical protein